MFLPGEEPLEASAETLYITPNGSIGITFHWLPDDHRSRLVEVIAQAKR